MKHKHYDVLIAIAEGREVEFYSNGEWVTAYVNESVTNPMTHDLLQWRVKPVPKEPEYCYVNKETDVMWITMNKEKTTTHRIRLEPLDEN